MLPRTPVLVAAVALVVSLGSPSGLEQGAVRPPVDVPLAAVEGRGLLDRVLCVGCIGTWVYMGSTGLGLVVTALAYPELPGACAYSCLKAVLE